jgi:hypothetical protein
MRKVFLLRLLLIICFTRILRLSLCISLANLCATYSATRLEYVVVSHGQGSDRDLAADLADKAHKEDVLDDHLPGLAI